MSVLFTSKTIGKTEIKNRFIHSATYEAMAGDNGEITDKLIKRYSQIATGGTGLIIPGYMFVMPMGRAMPLQTGIYNDDMIEGLKKLVDAVHAREAKIAFQLVHSGRQTFKKTIGQSPKAPSRGPLDNMYLVKPKELSEQEIYEIIKAFGAAASRAAEAGADGVQIHSAHGYLVNQFLSPFFNKRKDSWGGSDENQFRFIKEIFQEIKKNVPDSMFIMVKLNTCDYTPKPGITIELSKKYAKWLAELPVDCIEVSSGTLCYSPFNMVRGEVPTKEILTTFPLWKKFLGKFLFKLMEGKFDIEEGYNIEAAKAIKPLIGETPLSVVGGLRKTAHMAEVLEKGFTDFISMSRPFIREPGIVNKINEGKADTVACVSCNRCFAAAANTMPVHCYYKGFPKYVKRNKIVQASP